MRRFLGLAFLFGAVACASSVDPAPGAPESLGTVASTTPVPLGGTTAGLEARGATGALAKMEAATGTCSSQQTLHGTPGTVIAKPSVTLLFWGSYWTSTGATERQGYTTAWTTLAADPAFYARLAEYSTSSANIGTGSWAGATLGDAALASGATITETQIQSELGSEIRTGVAASNTASRVYVVMLPPGVTSQLDHDSNFAGHHSQFSADLPLPVRYAVITYNTDPGYTNPVVSHEITEATTDPDLATGWYDQFGFEIGDVCRFNYWSLDGVTIEQTYSMRSCSCIGSVTNDVADAGQPDTGTTPACTAPAWSSSGTYPGGTIVSFHGSQYTAAFWSQNAEPDTHSGPTGTGQPWLPGVACGPTTCTPSCGGKQCGSDGCGGSCGGCTGAQECSATGQCVSTCTPSCNGKTCGNDGCGGTCGTCGAGQTCSTSGTCQTATTGCGRLSPWDPNKPWYSYTVGEEHVGSNNHRYTCKNVAYCIDDPTSAVGGTYGWTDQGPC
jgi:hypothetical protein